MASATLAQLRQPAGADGAALMQSLMDRPYTPRFDPEAWHAMQERDTALIRDELLHGAASSAFVYDFKIGETRTTGVSVVGARELASQYKGIKSRIVATIEKRGSLFIFRTFSPLSIETRTLPELAEETDFYECVMEVSDLKTGNSIEVRKKETKTEKKRNGQTFDRPHYDVIAESKAFRNGVLSVLPQSVIREFKERCLNAGQVSGEKTLPQLRAQAMAHGAKHGIALDRQAMEDLTYDEILGLGQAAAQGLDAFKRSAIAMGLIAGVRADPESGELPPEATPAQAPAPKAAEPAPAPAPQQAQQQPADDAAGYSQAFGDDKPAAQAPAAAPAPRSRRAPAAGPAVE